ncbi:NAD(P)H-binding protein [Actinosynnema sp. NPDC047251]|uniref:Nucleotide-diphosphate-sugar epimerase n=1 Tax=Saccharothrix espanaensis (strain ATCC 51144 / DSM 44229 / JCM 9112 / NBRC 15066 / NRRL 15764) TaxID=1179773 RepID=K0JUG5_SACES|nr:NAD(P)H-binding protein [Saccharothrix espanaensis]CCH31490.1 Nucleotide-diphosphate-sugar epimerase [Saccharothrix espanaensis DSM 44229]
MTVLVTGATGTVGRPLVHHLLAAGHRVRALTRDPARAALPAGVEVVRGDTTDTGSLHAAFAGVTAAHLINFGHTYRPLANGPEIVAAAEAAGVRRVTLLGGWAEGSLEPAVRAGGLEWTHLRPGEFMANTLADWGPVLRAGDTISEPYADRPTTPVHEADIAAVAFTALTEDGHHGRTYALTGPEVVTPRTKLELLGRATGRDLTFDELTPDQARARWTAQRPALQIFQVAPGGPADQADFVLRLYGDIPAAGRTPTDTVERVTGRPARTFAQWAAENAAAFHA